MRSSIVLRMNLQNSFNNSPNYNLQQIALNNLAKQQTKKAPTSLKAPMIDRIFNVRPGCGSCGRG